jgi:SAM-dependent methyltransferase
MRKTRRRVQKSNSDITFDKYELYSQAVQSADVDVALFRKVYRELKKKDARILREDFCGTFQLSKEWIKLNPKFSAHAVDLDPEPLSYGLKRYWMKLSDTQKRRLHVHEMNVMDKAVPAADLIVAMNFSYFIFKTRDLMKQYFANVYRSTKKDGVFLLDVFGGSGCFDENEEITSFKKFKYYWHQTNFDPISNRALFHIHFRPNGAKKVERVFSYDWRMWSIPELRDILHEVGFKLTHAYWEGTNKKGGGDGEFRRTNKGEACDSWIAYIAAEK